MTDQDTSGTTMTARAHVATDSPDRYAKQLVAHLGRKVEFAVNGRTSTASIGGGTGTVVVGDGILTLVAEGPNEAAVALIEHVLGSHLERFGARNELVVDWQHTVEPTQRPSTHTIATS